MGVTLLKRLSSEQKQLYTNGNKTLCGYEDTFVYNDQKGGRVKNGTHGVENVRSNLGGREIYGSTHWFRDDHCNRVPTAEG